MLKSGLKTKLIAFKKFQSQVQSQLCSSNHSEMASEIVKIIIFKIDEKDEISFSLCLLGTQSKLNKEVAW